MNDDLPAAYRPVFSDEAVASFLRLTKARQRILLEQARALASDPWVVPDFTSTDADGRIIAHIMAGDFIFSYWNDDPVRLTMILAVEDVR